jgi:putative DNA primase/helicase
MGGLGHGQKAGEVSEYTEHCRVRDEMIDGAQKWVSMGFELILLYGIVGDGISDLQCTCSKGAACRSAGKHPVYAGWQAENISWRPPTKDAWRHNKKTLNFGVRMGNSPKSAEWIAIDVDGAKGAESMHALEATHGGLPPTLTQRTGSGGLHLIFRWADDADDSRAWRMPTTSASVIGPGIDIRGNGGQIVAAPSVHQSGTSYRIITDMPPALLPRPWYDFIAIAHECDQ